MLQERCVVGEVLESYVTGPTPRCPAWSGLIGWIGGLVRLTIFCKTRNPSETMSFCWKYADCFQMGGCLEQEAPILTQQQTLLRYGWSRAEMWRFGVSAPSGEREDLWYFQHDFKYYPPWNKQFAPENRFSQKERIVFQPSIFRCELLDSGRVRSPVYNSDWRFC